MEKDLDSINRGRQVIDGLFGKEDHLEHHGILGQKWGVRRFQNKDGSLTAEGKNRKVMNTTKVATVLGGPLFGAAAGLGHLAAQKFKEKKNDTEKDENESQGNKTSFGSKERNDTAKSVYDKMRNSFKTDEEKDSWEHDMADVGPVTRDKYGFLNFTNKNKLPVSINSDDVPEEDAKLVVAAKKASDYLSNKENLSKVKDQVVDSIMKDDYWSHENATKDGLKNNLRVYGMYVAGSDGDTVYGEISCEHRNMSDANNAPYGDHSIDVDFSYDTKTKKITTGQYSING